MNFKKSVKNFTNSIMRGIGVLSTYQIQITLKVNGRVKGVDVINSDGVNEAQARKLAEKFVMENLVVETTVLKKLSSKEVKAERKRLETITVNN